MALTPKQVKDIRDKADNLLKKIEADGRKKEQVQLDNKMVVQLLTAMTNSMADFKSYMTNSDKRYQSDQKAISKALMDVKRMTGNSKDSSNYVIVNALKDIANKVSTPVVYKGKDKKYVPPVDRTDEVIEAIQGIEYPKMPEIEFPKSIAVDNFPPTRVPQPVTNININPLRGIVETTTQTLTTTLSKVPGYGELDGRRSLMIYNNDSSETIYIGGSDVTSSNGFPIPAKSYSPAFDAGPKMIVYGLTASSTAEVRVLEMSNDSGG